MMKFALGFVVGLILLPLFAFLFILLGYAPVATSAPPFPLERYLAGAALKARISREAPKDSPVPATPENLVAGARLYREYCAVCHGTKGAPETPTAHGMYPRPPQLMKGKGVTDDPVGETYWKVSNGIRLTGMPAYGLSLDSSAIWQVSQMLANAAHLPPEAETILAAEPPAK